MISEIITTTLQKHVKSMKQHEKAWKQHKTKVRNKGPKQMRLYDETKRRRRLKIPW